MVRENDGRTALLELSFALSGGLKLLGLERRMFQRWGMSARQMRRVGWLEAAGALLVANPGTRKSGATLLAALSAVMLAVELRNHEAELVLPRLGLTALALGTAVAQTNRKTARA